MGYKQLDYKMRCQIYGLWSPGYKQAEIAKEVGVHKSTISRELNRNITFVRTKLGSWQCKPNYAQGNANERHKKKRKHVKFTNQVEAFFREKIQENWSPDQISGYAKRQQLFSISHEWICQANVSDNHVAIIADKLNNRPRKSLGNFTPNELLKILSIQGINYVPISSAKSTYRNHVSRISFSIDII